MYKIVNYLKMRNKLLDCLIIYSISSYKDALNLDS